VLLIDEGPLLIVGGDPVLPLPLAPGPLLEELLLFFGGVHQEDVEHVPHDLAADEMTVILDPAGSAVLGRDPVLHIVQIEPAAGDLALDALLHPGQVIGMDDAAEGVSREAAELLQGVTAEDPQKAPVGKNDLLVPAGLIDQKSTGHLLHEIHHLPGGLQLLLLGEEVLRPTARHGAIGLEQIDQCQEMLDDGAFPL
jgi:hypothetical protein